ncbi:MAG: lipoate--protein ligase family protein [Thermoproteota archaeon]|nr:MAG: lipoate--protein ligase family protein [Candidatus Korarchaeota archaeon]
MRLLLVSGDAAFNMALDELLLNLATEIGPTIRFYGFSPSAITIGYFQRVEDAINLEEARKLGISFVRRMTGGGAVYHDENGEITYSVVLPARESVLESFKRICNGVVLTLRRMGIPAEFSPINDVVVNKKKISGSAQTRRFGFLLQHGTIMYGTDLNVMEKVLLPPKKLAQKGLSSIRDRVTTAEMELGRRISFDEILSYAIKGFSEALGDKLDEVGLEELSIKDRIREIEAKYRSREWNWMR